MIAGTIPLLELIVGVILKSVVFAINSWVKLAGKRVQKIAHPLLGGPMLPKVRIGAELYEHTLRSRLEAWSESLLVTRFFLRV